MKMIFNLNVISLFLVMIILNKLTHKEKQLIKCVEKVAKTKLFFINLFH